MNTLNYLKAICYQYKAKFRDLENLFPRINNGEVEITPEIDEIVATTNISENTGIERPCRVCLVKEQILLSYRAAICKLATNVPR